MTSNIYVLYHAHCTDGTGSKFAAWKKFKDTATYIAVQYGKPMPEMVPNSRVFIVDFSYPREVLDGLRSVHQEVVVLDHHKTAEEALRGCPGCHFDMNKSGAVMAWEYFHPGTEVPKLLQHIQDRDLWKFKMDGTKAVHIGLQLLKGDMRKWDEIVTDACEKSHRSYWSLTSLIKAGNTLLEKQNMVVENAVKNHTKVIKFLGHKVGISNQSDIASEIAEGIYNSKELNVDFAIVYCITKDNEALLSLRSKGDMDVAAIAQNFGGGGHLNAAGCRINMEQLFSILKENYA